ncbi:hypothetical protein [Microtetraspora malaysiensis]|uniref:MYXO-CTERM domain-containing protein n=1 Tax=Microtetraspora malaysiensis TaxID=161358 RepID=A0ABW6T494_9ACTN
MSALSQRREPASVRHSAKVIDGALAMLTVVIFVAVAFATGVQSPWRGPVPVIPLALFLGALLFVRRRWPMASRTSLPTPDGGWPP